MGEGQCGGTVRYHGGKDLNSLPQTIDPDLLGRIRDTAPRHSLWAKTVVVVRMLHMIYKDRFPGGWGSLRTSTSPTLMQSLTEQLAFGRHLHKVGLVG